MARSMTRSMRALLRALRPRRRVLNALPRVLRRLLINPVPGTSSGAIAVPSRSARYSLKGVQQRIERAQGKFFEKSYRHKSGSRRYKLFVPTAESHATRPLLVMLHGCTQTPDEFALITGMNDLATKHDFVVVYPAQSALANRSKCWNWFRSSDQQRGAGEPAILAGLTRQMIKAYGLDRRRVYVAGLSAGAAMAVILARAYPDLYAAIGVHSGLPYAAAHDESSAFAAMRGESIARDRHLTSGRHVPTIVIHGDCDRIVHPKNMQQLFDDFIDGHDARTLSTVQRRIDDLAGKRACSHIVVRDANGIPRFEHWLVHGGGHAWFGGHVRTRHADPAGPDASVEMLRFFFEQLEHAS